MHDPQRPRSPVLLPGTGPLRQPKRQQADEHHLAARPSYVGEVVTADGEVGGGVR